MSGTFIDLFAGCGGLSLGLMKAGWSGLFAIEKSTDAFETLHYNLCRQEGLYKFSWPDWLPCQAMTTSKLLKKYSSQLEGLRGHVDLIAGGPPCQGFSLIGLRDPNDPRNKLTGEYIKLVDILRPRFLLLENVRGFQAAFAGKKKPYSEVVKEKLEGLSGGGYQVYSKMVHASEVGVPQSRPRFIMIAIRKDLQIKASDPFSILKELIPHFREQRGLNGHNTTVAEAIGDLTIKGKKLIRYEDNSLFFRIAYKAPKKLSGYQSLMRSGMSDDYIPNGLRLPNHKPDTVKKFLDILSRSPKGETVSTELREEYQIKKQCLAVLHPDKLSRTVTTLPDDMIHYSEPRILTVRENARLQSFPDWFEFKGKYTTGGPRRKKECPRYTQVGNAVPPLMAEAIGLAIGQIENE